MSHRVVTYAERPDLDDRWEETVRPAWPEFLLHDAVANANWRHLFERFPEFQFFLYDEQADSVLGIGSSIPFPWDGTAKGLPNGIDGVLRFALAEHERGTPPTALSALEAVVTVGNQGTGLSGVIVRAMRDLAAAHGLADLVAPVRPTMKSRYPLTPMDSYMQWTREDGLPLDAWFRVHRRAGAEFVGVCHESMTVRGTVEEWEAWTDMVFPESGAYVVPGALVPVTIDRERDVGLYVEPNVWMLHRVGEGG